MKKASVIIAIIFNSFFLIGQENESAFGLKAGINFGKYTPKKGNLNYKFKLGPYAGLLYKTSIEEHWEFQTEVLLSLRGSRIAIKDLNVPNFDYNGNSISGSSYDFEYQVNELTISVPLLLKAYFNKKVYLEFGPELAFIVDRSLNSNQQILSGEDNSFIVEKGDTFGFGLDLGLGFKFSEKISMNLRSYFGLIKRDDEIKSLVINLGFEYSL